MSEKVRLALASHGVEPTPNSPGDSRVDRLLDINRIRAKLLGKHGPHATSRLRKMVLKRQGGLDAVRERTAWQPVTVSLRRLFPLASFVGCGDIRVSQATDQSGRCVGGGVFAAVRGTREDGLEYVEEALSSGVAALLVPHPVSKAMVPQCVVPDVRAAYARLCQALAGDPATRLKLTGVTGTNGKTTIAWMLRSIWQAAGIPSGLLGTIEYDDGGHTQRAELTTPASETLASWLAAMVARGTTHAALELSSHALDQDRAAGVALESVVLTNLTQDHFDYHGDLANYSAAKAAILDLCSPGGTVVFNADDPGIVSLVDNWRSAVEQEHTICSFGVETDADVTGQVIAESVAGTHVLLTCRGKGAEPDRQIELKTRLVGRHNLLNCLAAACVAVQQGIDSSAISTGIENLGWVPGRLELVECDQPFDVFVDYAHTEDALRRCLAALRRVVVGRLICVFGAGGDRDQLKRPLLGAAVADTADVCIVTNDNPRNEDPQKILEAVADGVTQGGGIPLVVQDREKAIEKAVAIAEPGDGILVAGKGHESHQEIGGRLLRFDDREVVRATLHGMSDSMQLGVDRDGGVTK